MDEWSTVKQRLLDANVNGKIMNNEKTIAKIQELSAWHLKMFIDYFDSFYYSKSKNLKTFRAYRSAILEFLLQSNINKKPFSEITQKDVDDYFSIKIDSGIKNNTINSNIYALRNYFEFHSAQTIFHPQFMDFKKVDLNPQNTMQPLNSNEIEDIRNYIKGEQYLKFVFEFAYENKVRFEDARDYKKENYNASGGYFASPSGERIQLSPKLLALIENIKDTPEFEDPRYKYGFTLDRLREILNENGHTRDKVKSNDINNALESNLSFKCPECGTMYEATAENWVIKQYYPDGNLWIVCKEKCGGTNEDI